MLLDTAADRSIDADPDGDAPAPKDAAIGPTLARLFAAVERGAHLYFASSEQRAEATAKAAASLTDALVLWFPPQDTMPGENTPSSPAIAGRRFAALHALHGRERRHVLFVTEATAA